MCPRAFTADTNDYSLVTSPMPNKDAYECILFFLYLTVIYCSQYEVNKFNAFVFAQIPHTNVLLIPSPPRPKRPVNIKRGTGKYVNGPLFVGHTVKPRTTEYGQIIALSP